MDRRNFLQRAGQVLVGALINLPLLGISVKPISAQQYDQLKTKRSSTEKVKVFGEELAGEDLWYQVSLVKYIKAAVGHISFYNDRRTGYYRTGAEAYAVGFVGWLTNYKKLGFYSTLKVVVDKGKPRLVTTNFERISTKMDTEYHSKHWFDYEKLKRGYKVYQDGKLKIARSRKIPEGIWYDDFIAAVYNFRLGVYGKVHKGMDLEVNTIPHKGVDRFKARVLDDKDYEGDDHKLLEKVKDSHYIVRVDIDQKIFGFKAGVARFVSDEKLKPIAASIQEVIHFGSVFAQITDKPEDH